ncbi:adhesin HecA-like repeat protein [Paraburkholderia sp. BL10I2N1]|nr:adhesin HecA-like repeat protein [Paraburkholderia sp. BL10I2N1]
MNTATLSNNGGDIATNGALAVNAGAVFNQGGTFAAQSQAAFIVASLDNSAGGYIGARDVSVNDAGGFNNAGGTVQANDRLDVSAQNRDTSDTNGTVAKLPNVSNLLDKQADMMSAASAAGEAVATRIGQYADSKRDAANAAADQAMKDGNPELAAQYQQEAADWAEGGTYRVALHTAGGGLIAGLGGGNAFAGAAGAGLSAALAGNLNQLSNAIYDANPTGDANANRMLGNILANALATGAGTLVGGNAGAFTGANVDLYNRSTSCNGAHCDDSNALGKRSDPLDAIRVDLVSKYCGAGVACTDAQLKQVMQAQAELSQEVNRYALDTVAVGGGAAAIAGAAVAGPEALAAYKAAQAGYSLYTAAMTGAGISGGIYASIATINAGIDFRNGQDFSTSFDQRFSVAGLGTAAVVGALNGMFATSMFQWAGIANSIKNVSTIPGFVIQTNKFALGQAAGKAAQGAVQQRN